MRRFRTTSVAIAFFTLSFPSICMAQQPSTTSVPNLIRYSGTLKDAQGVALSFSTAVGVTFSIYKQQDGGAAVWMETQNITPDSNGQYSVILGGTTAAGLPGDLFSQQEQRWLGVQVQGQAEQPRVLLVSVPYAFKAHEAETLGGLPASAFVRAAPTDAPGSAPADMGTSVNALRTTSGTGSLAGSPPPPLATVSNGPCPPGTVPSPNFVPLWFKPAVNSNIICNSVIFQTPIGAAGNVGIGTTAPSAKLDVNGPINTASYYEIFGARVLSIDGYNTSVGPAAGLTTGSDNVSVGGQSNNGGSGSNNTFVGTETGMIGEDGNDNTFLGFRAGFNHTQGDHNIFIGSGTGNQGAVTNNIYLDANCPITTCDLDHPETYTTRIGTQGRQTDAYMAGINNAAPGTLAPIQTVCVDGDGKLWGVSGSCPTTSSRRFKEQILDMGDSSSRLFQLRPVTFLYKPQYDDGSHQLQYGLIAEEVAKVYPDLVAYDKDGSPYTVKYQYLAPMLLNELQKQHAVVTAQQEQIQTQGQQITDLQQRLLRLESLIANK